ncbi:MAG: sialate O-acetylesterase [Verrucomicrobia bacterium]|nr:sialate O-acetylesterase [Verrucomicrobiota bacterium]
MNIINQLGVALVAAVVTWGTGPLAAAEMSLQMGLPFGDGAVLQQQVKVPVWGWTAPAAEVTIRFAGQELATTADESGRWEAFLQPLLADSVTDPAVAPEGKTMTVTASKNGATASVVIKGILVGEVWLCAGQSNMGFGLKHVLNAGEEIAKAQYPVIRTLPVSCRASAVPMERSKAVPWVSCTPEDAADFSATGYFFARHLLKELKVPIGLLHVTRGGGVIEPFIAPGGYLASSHLPEERAFVEKSLSAEARAAAGSPAPKVPPLDPTQPCVGFNGAIAPLIPYAMRGVIWYQGESNAIHAKPAITTGRDYLYKMEALVGGWRELWGLGDFPFYYVQLANFGGTRKNSQMGDPTAMIRQAQLEALRIRNSGMAVMIDGNGDIHPPNKQETGERLALWALAGTYGRKDLVFSGPLYQGFSIEGRKIRIKFDHAESGLMVATKEMLKPAIEDKGAKIKWLSIQGKDEVWHRAEGAIDGNDLLVSSEDVSEPIAVRYAYVANPSGCNLYNRAGLPAAAFTTTDY